MFKQFQVQYKYLIFDGYFAIAQRLPEMLEVFDLYSKIVLTVYDTREKLRRGDQPEEQIYAEGRNITILFMLGGSFQHRQQLLQGDYILQQPLFVL